MTSSTAVFHLLPITIESVSLPFGQLQLDMTSDDWDAISKLTNLRRLLFCISSSFGVLEAQKLPRSLEKLQIFTQDGAKEESRCIEILKALPPHLQELDVDGMWPKSISPNVAKNMPITLKNIGIRKILPESVAFLPENMEDLLIAPYSDLTLISAFPPKLLDLTITHIRDSLVDKLPISLECLDIRTELADELLSRLPIHLTSLRFSWALGSSKDLSALFQALPRTLTSLTAAPTSRNPTTRAALIPAPSSSSLLLPRSLKKLDIGYLDFSVSSLADWICGLPTGLTSFVATINGIQHGAFSAFRTLSALDSLMIGVLNSPIRDWADYVEFGSLPRRLTSLTVNDWENHLRESKITNESLRGAPKSLRFLTLPPCPRLTKECLAYLPNLRRFNIGGKVETELAKMIANLSNDD
jgi:hypothetical protein